SKTELWRFSDAIMCLVAGNQLTGPKEVKQCAGRPIHIICRYHAFYRDHVKYWCKGYYFNDCTTLLRTDQPAHASGPLTIADNKKEGFFTIHMTNVKPGDNGWYWCAIERVSRHVSISMELIISSEYCLSFYSPEIIHSFNKPSSIGMNNKSLIYIYICMYVCIQTVGVQTFANNAPSAEDTLTISKMVTLPLQEKQKKSYFGSFLLVHHEIYTQCKG
uniref:Immunoglobulin V-set domain-containing protein n=1 Tax=Pygocentrus nattereri TaxID=42514 RepID=A0A3B4EP45_PYGNA